MAAAQDASAAPAAAAQKPRTRLPVIFSAAAMNRASLSRRTVAVVHELKVVRPPARPVAKAVCQSAVSPSCAAAPCDSPMMKHPTTFTTKVAHGQCRV